jgi:nucleotide-binding universal stress UspA family protein
MSTRPTQTAAPRGRDAAVARIAVGVDGYPEGQDATVLGAMIAHATGAQLMLVAVHPDPVVVLPSELGWRGMHAQAEEFLRNTRDEEAPEARIVVETDWSVPRALGRVVRREHRDLLVVGSTPRAPEGRVQIARRTRQLLCHCPCALGVAPRGWREHRGQRFERIGVGYDGTAEARAALALAGSIAGGAGARLVVRAVVDDRIPTAGWLEAGRARVASMWHEMLEPQAESLRADADAAAAGLGRDVSDVNVEVLRGAPADALAELCGQVDLLVIGSRRWGAVSRVLLGSTGEALMRGASCPVLVAPRLAEDAED